MGYQRRVHGDSSKTTKQLNMKVLGLVLMAMASFCLLTTTSAAPIIDPITAASFTTAGGLVLTMASAATITVPTAALLATKALAVKGLVVKAALAARSRKKGRRGRNKYTDKT